MELLDKFYGIKQAGGLAIVIGKDGSAVVNYCQVSLDGKNLSFEKKVTGLSLQELRKQVKTGIPLSISISGKGVLYKQVEKIEEIGPANFSAVLPNASIDDFYVQHFPSGEHSFVAVIRKTEVDKWLDAISEQGLAPLMLSLGPFPVAHILPQLNIYDEEIIFAGIKIARTADKSWEKVSFHEEFQAPYTIKVENEVLDQQLLLPYAAAFQLLLSGKLDALRADVPTLESAFEDLISDRKFKVNGMVILLIFFVLLLGNFVWLSGLNVENARLSAEVSTSARTSTDQQALNDKIKQKESLLRDLGWDGGINKSSLIDQAAALMPGEITLKEISVSPIDGAADHGFGSLKFRERKILIRGESAQIIPVNEWAARLKSKKWVKNVELESYNFNNELNTGIFTITLSY
jgi:Tfp pilus assembly protein PilN